MQKIPVTVITGFLGAGKTTLIRHLLQHNHGRRIAVLVNEFGEVGIDGDLLRSCQVCDDETDLSNNIVELANGCLCCTVQEEFYPTMQLLLERREQIDCVVIETSGLALPKPLVQAFRWPEIRQGATVDGVVTVVDCAALAAGNLVGDLAALTAQRAADENLEHETPLEELFEDQLACADLVLLTKADLVEDSALDLVKGYLESCLRSGIKVILCHQGTIAPDLLLGVQAAVENHLYNRSSHHDHETEHEHDEGINSVCLEFPVTIAPEKLIGKLKALVKSQEIYRIKGFINIPNKPMRLVLQGVGDRFETFYDRFWTDNENRETKLVFIGRELVPVDLKNAIEGL